MNIHKLSQRPQVFNRFFGISPQQFKKLTQELEPLWQEAEYERKSIYKRQRAVGGGRQYKLSFEQMVAMYLLYTRTYMSHIMLAEFFHIDDSRVCRYFKKLEPILFQKMKNLTIEKIRPTEEEMQYLLDATEQETERRLGSGYSGKKKKQTVKTQVVTDIKGRIKHISQSVAGNIHDKKLYDQTGVKLRDTDLGDLGYLGTNLRIPHKASKYHKLTKKQKMENKAHSSVRIMIEHVFASLKQWRILSYRFRNQLKTYHMKFVIVAGLYNLKHC